MTPASKTSWPRSHKAGAGEDISPIYAVNFKTIPLLIVASIWYLIVTSVLTAGQYYIERHYARGAARELPPTPWQRIRRILFTVHAPLPASPTQRRDQS